MPRKMRIHSAHKKKYIDNAISPRYGHARGLRHETEKKVFEALNNKNWGASSTTLNNIARDTYSFEKFQKIFKLVWEAADSPPRNWRKVFKALMLCEYLVKNGCERCVDEIRDHAFQIRQLQDFNYYEEKLDRGQGVREKAKKLVELLADSSVIRDARENAKRLRDKFVGHGSNKYSGHGGKSSLSSHISGTGGYSDNCGNQHYLDHADSSFSISECSDNITPPSDAPGRYNSEPSTLQIKPKQKSKAVPRINIKDEYKTKMPIVAAEPVKKRLPVESPPPRINVGDMLFATPTQTAQDLTFDPRGALPPSKTSSSATFQSTVATLFAPSQQPQMQVMNPQPPQLAEFPTQYIAQKQVPQIPTQLVGSDDFGDFATCPPPVVSAPPLDAVSSLCSLDSLSLNVSSALSHSPTNSHRVSNSNVTSRNNYAQHSAFTGIDGF